MLKWTLLGGTTLLILSAVLLYFHIQNAVANKVYEPVNNLNSVQGQIAQVYADQPSYGSTPMTADLIAMGIMPSNWVTSPETLQNPWGGPVTIQPVADGKHFSIFFGAVPQEDCIKILIKLAGGVHQANLLGFHVVPDGPAGAPQQPSIVPPVTAEGANAACHAEQGISMTFFYR